jgi:MOSC domain-containing protein YiiM
MRQNFPRVGRVEWIGLSPGRREPIVEVQRVLATAGLGLDGDRHGKGGGSQRQVTLIQHEHLTTIGALLGQPPIAPARLRRNLVISGLPVRALRGVRFRVGQAVLVGTKDCDPCSRMEEELGPGGFNAMTDIGGECAIVENGGWIEIGNEVVVL